MKVKRCSLPSRILSAFLAVLVPVTSLPPNVWATPNTPIEVAINNGTPDDIPERIERKTATRPPKRLPVAQVEFNRVPRFTTEPRDEEFAEVRGLEERLAPAGTTTVAENKLLAAVISRYVQRADFADQSELLAFLERFPDSAWRPALLVNLGVTWRRTGHFTKALTAWQEAWYLTKSAPTNPAKTIADRACAEYLQMNAWIGRYQTIELLLQEVSKRQFSPTAAAIVTRVGEGLWFMKNQPDKSFSCGPYAIREILTQTRASPNPAKVMEAKPTGHGFNLTQVAALAREQGLNYRMAKRSPGAPIPINSVV